MADKNGKLIICDRCGETAFCECNGEGERDGGFTRWNKFDPPPEGWSFANDCETIHRLCPGCNKIYRDMIKNFENPIEEINNLVAEGVKI